MEALVHSAFSLLSDEEIKAMKPFGKFFYLDDKGHGYYTTCSDKYTDKIIPCWAFDHWKEAKIDDYSETCEKIKDRSSEPWKFDKLFWAGQISHPSRAEFADKFQGHPKMEIVCHIDHWGHRPGVPPKYLSLPDHCDYKYMLDLQGAGYSARTKFLFHTKRTLFYQDRKFHEYWFWSMEPFVHYIPIKEDLSDFEEKFEWAEDNPEECRSIAQNAYDFALSNLRRSDALERLKRILFDLGTKERNQNLFKFYSSCGDERQNLGVLELLPNGRIGMSGHPNESFWTLNGDELTIWDSKMKPTCVMSKKADGEYSGLFILDKNVTHNLSAV